MKRTTGLRHGFTLVELLVVIAIIGIFDCSVVAGRAGGARSGSADAMCHQPASGGDSESQLQRCIPLLPGGVRGGGVGR